MRGIPISDIAFIQVQYFLKTVELKSFTKAARVLHVTQSAVSKSIGGLETLLELQLFIRKNQSLQVTPAGKYLYEKWSEGLSIFESSIEHAHEIQRGYGGNLVIGAHESLYFDWLILPVLKEYKKSNPSINVRIETANEVNLTSMLMENELDIVVTVFTDFSSTPEKLFNFLVLDDMPAEVCMLNTNPLASKEMLQMNDLRGSNFVSLLANTFPSYAELMKSIASIYGFSPNITCYVSTINAMPLNLLTDNDVFLCNRFFFDRKDYHLCSKPLHDAHSSLVACWNKDEQRLKVLDFVERLGKVAQKTHSLQEWDSS